MAQLMRHDARHFVAAQHRQQARGGRDGGMVRVAAGREGIGMRLVDQVDAGHGKAGARSEEHTSELQSLMRTSYAVFCLKKKSTDIITTNKHNPTDTVRVLTESETPHQ